MLSAHPLIVCPDNQPSAPPPTRRRLAFMGRPAPQDGELPGQGIADWKLIRRISG